MVGLLIRLDMTIETISEFEDISTDTSKTEKLRGWGEKTAKYPNRTSKKRGNATKGVTYT